MKRYFLLAILLIGMVSAQTYTCPESVNDGVCVEYSADECADNCLVACIPLALKDTTECALGTCVDATTGMCSYNTPLAECEAIQGSWSADVPATCNLGCCQYDGGVSYTTEGACSYYSTSTGIDVTWDSTGTEQECLALTDQQTEGACVFENEFEPNECAFTTTSNCASQGGVFYPGYLCTHDDLGTGYQKQATTGCVEGRDEVYWFDSAGNRENIYDSNKVRSWNDGLIQDEPECELGTTLDPLANQARCGVCERFGTEVSTVCGTPGETDVQPLEGEYVCKTLTCSDEWGNIRQNGESWCSYESAIGFTGESNEGHSTDTVGSTHYKSVCIDGEVRLDQCQTGRREICVQDDSDGVSNAECRVNSWQQCITYNNDETTRDELCEADEYCALKTVAIDSGFTFNRCVPQYPPGFLEGDERSEVSAETICSLGSGTCVISFQKKRIGGGYECVNNCECMTGAFSEAMNNLCVSLGDCGAYYNVEEVYSDRGVAYGGRAFALTDTYATFLGTTLTPVEGVFAMATGLETLDNAELSEEIVNTIVLQAISSGGFTIDDVGQITAAVQSDIFTTAFVAYSGWFLRSPLPVSIFEIFGIGEGKTRSATFECLPWEVPTGSDDCLKCGEDDFGCNEYKCLSLGSCEYLSENEGLKDAPLCIPKDVTELAPPVIQPDPSAFSTGLTHQVTANGFEVRESDGSCLQEFSSISLGVMFDEPAKCRFDITHTDDYYSMGHTFGEPYLLFAQSEQFIVPSLDSLYQDTLDPDDTGEYNLLLRCIDSNGNGAERAEYAINICISEEPDMTAPAIGPFVPSPGLAAFGADEYTMHFFVGEPAECRWDNVDKDYNSMNHQANCVTDLYGGTLEGWECSAPVDITSDSTTVYVRCLDQPWLDDPEYEGATEGRSRNANTQGVSYTIERSTSPLTISSITPNDETVASGVAPALVDLEVTTSGGIDSTAICSMSFDGGTVYTPMFSTGGSIHEQQNLQYDTGSHEIALQCEDAAGNIAEETASFEVVIDTTGPLITRAYAQSGQLTIITNEPSECGISIESCSFTLEEATLLSGADLVHTTDFEGSLTHYVKCQDTFGTYGSCLTLQEGYA